MTRRRLLVLASVVVLLAQSSARAQENPRGPMRVVLLIDSSVSMSPMLTQFRACLARFLEALPGDPELVLASTGGQLRVRQEPTTDRSKMQKAAAAFASDGGGNMLLESLLEADQRFFRKAPDLRPVFVILTTDMGTSLGAARIDPYNRFVDGFLARGGRAHAIVIRGLDSGIVTQLAENLTQNTGGFYETVIAATAAPSLMELVASYVGADE